jgi:cellulose synthase/poly-beta-1,6-N-acetylglucosamine synthase-like glycosyltransferase
MLILTFILIFYALFLLWNWIGIALSSSFDKVPQGKEVTVLIPFHNEEYHLVTLWHSLRKLNGLSSAVELIFVNDHSDDQSASILSELIKNNEIPCEVSIIDSIQRGKKSSIQLGVEQASNECILIIDADVVLDVDWLQSMLTDLQNADLVVGSVINQEKGLSLLNLIQDSEALMLEGIKTASINNSFPLLASGANLGFKKTKFLEANPYKDNLEIPSGDDMFLLQAANNENWSIISKRQVSVPTTGATNFKS